MATILVIDDEPAVRRSLTKILQLDGHEVLEAADGRAALDLGREHTVDAVITDVYMPEMDGIEFLIAYQDLNPDVPIIAISGGGFADKDFVLKDAGMIGAVETLQKPLTVDGVRAAVQRALARRAQDDS
jgi:DNA-binding NtrC family response regulator